MGIKLRLNGVLFLLRRFRSNPIDPRAFRIQNPNPKLIYSASLDRCPLSSTQDIDMNVKKKEGKRILFPPLSLPRFSLDRGVMMYGPMSHLDLEASASTWPRQCSKYAPPCPCLVDLLDLSLRQDLDPNSNLEKNRLRRNKGASRLWQLAAQGPACLVLRPSYPRLSRGKVHTMGLEEENIAAMALTNFKQRPAWILNPWRMEDFVCWRQ